MSLTFYPDVQSEPDNSIYASDGSAWATARNAASGTLRTRTDKLMYAQSTLSGATRFIERTFINFDTSSIPDDTTIISAVLSIYVTAKTKTDSPSYRLYGSTATDSLVGGDYDLMGTTELSDTYVTDPSTSAYVDFTLNAAGLAAISKIGKTKFCIREAVYDLGNTQPGGANVLTFSNSNETGTGQDPKLVVTYGTTYSQTYTDVITIVEAISRSETRVLTDVPVIVDAIAKSISRSLTTEVITIVDTISKQSGKILSETITITEGIMRSIGKIVSDEITIAESFVKSIARTLTDTISISEIFSKVLNYFGRLPTYIRAMASPKPTGFANDKDKPGIGVAHSVDKPKRV